MLEKIATFLFVVWLLGAFIAPFPGVGSFVHILLFAALIVATIRLVRGAAPRRSSGPIPIPASWSTLRSGKDSQR